MKRVTFTYTIEVEDNLTDSEAIDVLLEVMSQDRHYKDDQFKVEHYLTSPDKRVN